MSTLPLQLGLWQKETSQFDAPVRQRKLWEQPKFLNETTEDWKRKPRSASWLELFFDLIYVVAISKTALELQSEQPFTGLLLFTFRLLLIWTTWVSITFFTDRFDSDDPVSRLLTLGAMLSVGMMSVHQSGYRYLTSSNAALGAASIHLILMLQYLRTLVPWSKFNQTQMATLTAYCCVYLIGSVLFAASVLLITPLKVVSWSIALVLDIGILVYDLLKGVYCVSFDHFPERMGLFTILVLGEMVMAIFVEDAGHRMFPWTIPVVLAFAVWWVYFETMDESVMGHKKLVGVWMLLQFLVVMGITAMAPAINLIYEHRSHHNRDARALLTLSSAVFFIGVALLHFITKSRGHSLSPMKRGFHWIGM